ncbi:MAG: tetratricopeptide repeat protein [Planctomycetaceae bacterium]|nr:tetratricopeptide repeat protein [Planctomycetaceae bacterium]
MTLLQLARGTLIGCFLVASIGAGRTEAGETPSASETPRDVERLVIEKLAAGQQRQAEAFIDEYVERHPDHVRMTFLKAVCMRSRFDIEGSGAVFRKVVEKDKDSVCGRCAALVLELDAWRDSTANFAKLRKLADEHPMDTVVRWMTAVQCRSHHWEEEGVRHYEKIVAVWKPGPVLVHQTYANLLEELGRFEDALVERRKTVEMEPAGWSYHGLGSTLAHLHRFKEANEAFEEAVNIAPTNVLSWHNWAYSLLREGRFDDAIAKCKITIDLDSREWQPWSTWSEALFGQGHLQEAVQKMRVALHINPSYGSGKVTIARIQARMRGKPATAKLHQFDAALAEDNKLIEANPKDHNRYWHRGGIHWENGDFDLAIADFNEALRLHPDDLAFYRAREMALVDKGEYEKALADAKRAVQLEPNHYAYRRDLGDVLLQMGRFEEAAAAFTEAVRLQPVDFDSFRNRARVRESQGNLDKALVDYNEAVRLYPVSAQLHFARGDLYRKLGKYESAVADYTKAVDFDPRHAEAYFNRGLAHRALGKQDKAKADFAAAMRLDSELKEPK